jgi:hypothetical protein
LSASKVEAGSATVLYSVSPALTRFEPRACSSAELAGNQMALAFLSIGSASWEGGSRFICAAPANVLDEVRAKLKPLLSL